MNTEVFNILSYKEQQMEIIKDALLQTINDKYDFSQKLYLMAKAPEVSCYQFYKIINQYSITETEKCYVCATGGLLASSLFLGNKYNLVHNGTSVQSQDVIKVLLNWFTSRQLILIEVAYEMHPSDLYVKNGRFGEPRFDEEIKKAIKFGK